MDSVESKKVKTRNKKEEPQVCPICAEKFTPIIRQPIQCPFCPYAACRQCASRYLLTTLNDPHCMGCKREWNREFIDVNLTQTFRKGPLRVHRRKVLIDREKGRLPAMQAFVEAQSTITRCADRMTEIRTIRKRLKRERNLLHINQTLTPDELERSLEPITTQLITLKQEFRQRDRELWEARRILTGETRPEARQFIMKCLAEGCRGFLSSGWKCGTCQKHFCSDCHAEKTGVKEQDEAHVCKEDAKATASMIRQETRACPSCGIRISKIEGCDQMWCVSCHTTFSWNTGQVLLNTVVHNPHYYEYLRKNNGSVPREAGDVPCGGLPNGYWFMRTMNEFTTAISQSNRTEILECLRCLNDIQHVRLPQYPLRQNANTNREVDIKYLMNQITEEEWGTTLERTESKGEQRREIGLILQTLLHVGSEKFTAISNSQVKNERLKLLYELLTEMRKVREYTNKSLLEKGIQMGMVVPQISNEWYWRMEKRKEMNKVKKDTRNGKDISTPQDEKGDEIQKFGQMVRQQLNDLGSIHGRENKCFAIRHLMSYLLEEGFETLSKIPSLKENVISKCYNLKKESNILSELVEVLDKLLIKFGRPLDLAVTEETKNVTIVPEVGPVAMAGAGGPTPRQYYPDTEEEEEKPTVSSVPHSPSNTRRSSNESESLVEVELADGERIQITPEQAREMFGAR